MHTRPFVQPSSRCRSLVRAAGVAVAFSSLLTSPAFSQGQPGGGGPDLDEQVRAAITAPYLKPQEAAALRVAHGVPTPEDLASPAARATHALDRGAYADRSLTDPAANPLDRAEGALARGDFAAAEPLITGDSLRSLRLRAQLFYTLGRNAQCADVCKAAVKILTERTLTASDDIVDAVQCAAILATLVDTSASGGGDHQAMMAYLGRARELDPFSWRVPLLEAQLLLDKDNYTEARAAAITALSHNPACAQALTILGEIAVNSFDLDTARSIADRLDAYASMLPLDTPGGGADDNLGLILAKSQPSIEAAFIRVRASLRQNEAEDAASELDFAAKKLPNAPLLAEMRCAVAAASYSEPALATALSNFKAKFADNPSAEARVGQTFSDLRQYELAIKHLSNARALAPFWPGPQIDLGMVLVQAGRDDEARETLDAATRLDPFNVRATNSLRLVKEIAGYARVETPHFVVRAKPGIDALLAAEIAKGMEENHAVVTGDSPGSLNYAPPRKTFIDLMPDHAWFAVRIAGLPRIHTIAASTGPVIAMEAPREGKGHTGTYDWPRVMRHEYTHTVGLSRTNNRMPHWFTEAQAQYLEHAPRDYQTARLLSEAYQSDELFDFTQINVAFTRPKKPTDRQLAYAQGQWMYEYMVERFGATAPLTLMDLYAKGVREEAAVQQTFSISREQFLSDFKAWAKSQLLAWGMLRPEGQPSLEKLMSELPSPADGIEPQAPTREQLAGWLKQYPDNPDVLRLVLQAAFDESNGELPESNIGPLLRYAGVRPVDPFPHQQLARIYLAQGKHAEAIPHLEWLDARADRSAVYSTQLAGLYAQAGQWDLAAAKAERAARITPYGAQSRELAATIAVQRKDFATARRHLEFLVALEPDRDLHKRRLEALAKLEATPKP